MPQLPLQALTLVATPWSPDWIWGCPLIVVTVIIHVAGLGFAARAVVTSERTAVHRKHPATLGAIVLGAATVLATSLHALEAGIWAVTYCFIGAMPDYKSAMLYSLGALSTYGHEVLELQPRWRMLGAIEALNGWLLFGLSSAFLFWLIQNLWPARRSELRN